MSSDSSPPQDDQQEPEAPRIEFPCLYPIKVIGRAEQGFRDQVIAAIERHTGKIDEELIEEQPSRKQNYLSVRVTIAATGEEQLRSLFEDLKAIDSVKMVL